MHFGEFDHVLRCESAGVLTPWASAGVRGTGTGARTVYHPTSFCRCEPPPPAVCRVGKSDRRSERLQGRLLFLVDAEKLVQLGDLEYLVNLRVNVAQDQLTADCGEFLLEGNQLTQGCT